MAFKINKRNFGAMAYLAVWSAISITPNSTITDGASRKTATIIDTNGTIQTAYSLIGDVNSSNDKVSSDVSSINRYCKFLNTKHYYVGDYNNSLKYAACLIPTKDDYSENAYAYTKVDCTITDYTSDLFVSGSDGKSGIIFHITGIANEETIIKGLAVSRSWQDTYKDLIKFSNTTINSVTFGKECNIGYITLDEPTTVKAGDNFSISCAISFG